MHPMCMIWIDMLGHQLVRSTIMPGCHMCLTHGQGPRHVIYLTERPTSTEQEAEFQVMPRP